MPPPQLSRGRREDRRGEAELPPPRAAGHEDPLLYPRRDPGIRESNEAARAKRGGDEPPGSLGGSWSYCGAHAPAGDRGAQADQASAGGSSMSKAAHGIGGETGPRFRALLCSSKILPLTP